MRRASTFLAICAVAMLALAFDVNAAPFYSIGYTYRLCVQFLSDNYLQQTIELEWMLGYITGRNREASNISERILGHGLGDINADFVWLKRYCGEHPFAPLYVAADALRATTAH